MASPDPEELHELVTKQKLPIRTSLYNKFFLLRLEIFINGQPAQVEADRKGWLTLYCRNPKVGVTFESLLAFVNNVLQQHGLHGVSNYWCEEVPLFELKISSHDDLTKLFDLEKKIQEDIASKIKGHMAQTKAESLTTTLDISVHQSIHLLTSSAAHCPVQVTQENISIRLGQFRRSEVADFRNLFTQSDQNSAVQKADERASPTLKELEEELHEIVDWFGLGVFLGVEGYELDIIKGNNGDIKQRRRDMFSIWLRAGNNKWSDIVEALQKLHREDIAKKIANNHGVQTSPSPKKDTTFSHDKGLRCCTREYLDEREKILEKTKQELKSCREAVDYYENEIKRLNEYIKHLQKERVSLEKALKKEKYTNESLKQKLQSLIQKLDESEMERSFLQDDLDINKQKLEDKGKLMEMQEKRNDKLKVQCRRRHYSKEKPTPKLPKISQNLLPGRPITSGRRTSLPEPQQPMLPYVKSQLNHKLRKCESSPETSPVVYRRNGAPQKQHPNSPKTASLFRREIQSRQLLSRRFEIQPLNQKLRLQWQKGRSAPEAIYRGTATVHENAIFLMGKDSPKVYKYDLIRDEWKVIPIQCPHINPGLVFIDGILTAVGGQTATDTCTKEVVSWEGEWVRKVPPMQQAHSNPIILVYKDWVIAMEGNDIEKTQVWKIHSFTWSSIKLQPPLDLKSFTATVYGDNLILVNTSDVSGCAIGCESLMTSITTTQSSPSRAANQTQQWRILQSLSKETTVTTFCEDAVCISDDGILYKLILDEGEWEETEDMTMASYTPVKAPIVCAVKNRLVVIGGVQGEICTNDVQIAIGLY